jgi:hypothetical protein
MKARSSVYGVLAMVLSMARTLAVRRSVVGLVADWQWARRPVPELAAVAVDGVSLSMWVAVVSR